jgi:mxaA protein
MTSMTKFIYALVLAIGICFTVTVAAADKPVGENLSPKDAPPVYVSVANPERDVGFHVGDVLQRIVTLKVQKPYKLLETSLPLAGNQKRYQGQKQGIETRSAMLEHTEDGDYNVYKLDVTYQVFTNNVVAKPAALPPEFVKFSGNGKIFQVRIPSWSFRISPLAVFGSVKIEYDMSAYRGPLLLDGSMHRYALWGLLGVLGCALLGLLYIAGNRSWLPRMGGPFARAYRDLRKLSADDAGLQRGVTRIHQAFNASHGSSVFTAEEFLATKPGFAAIRDDIERFFLLSRTVFFDVNANPGIEGSRQDWLRQFCRRCRDCERGLK